MNKQEQVYVIDDNELVLETIKRVLHHAGFSVKTYSSAQKFLFDFKGVGGCLVVDLRMPEMDGLSLQRLMQEKNILLPVIFLSGSADISSAVQAMENGAFTFLQKPINNQELISAIQTAISQDKHKAELAAPAKAAQKALNKLTERERIVSLLVTEGLSATEIAEKLFISARTVESHKASAFTKLDIHTIAQLTRLVVLANYSGNRLHPVDDASISSQGSA